MQMMVTLHIHKKVDGTFTNQYKEQNHIMHLFTTT